MKIALILKSPDSIGKVSEDLVIYADAGYNHCKELGEKKVLAVVGDFDSLGAKPDGCETVSLNVEKNFTDGEFALRYAVQKGATEVVIYGGLGGKIEHVLGNIALLKIANELCIDAYIKKDNQIIRLIHKNTLLTAKKGAKFSLIPYSDSCTFSKSFGLYYPLNDITLTKGDTRGISNEVVDEKVKIEITSGQALAIYEE